jgi:hypothetical protein
MFWRWLVLVIKPALVSQSLASDWKQMPVVRDKSAIDDKLLCCLAGATFSIGLCHYYSAGTRGVQ